MNFRDLSRNCMARERALYDGHAVAAVAAISPAIAEEACELIEVDYHVLPHVIDVEEAMKPDAPLLHDDLFTQGVEPKPTQPSNIAKRVAFAKGDVEAGFREADVIIERRYTTKPVHQAYIEPHACVVSYASRRAVHDLELEPGPVHGPRLLRQIARHRHFQHPRDPGRDRRRVRRQDAGLSRAAGSGDGEEIRPAGQDGDEPRGGVPRHRADLGRRHRGQDRRQEGRARSSPPTSCSNTRPAPSRARRWGRAACAALPCTTSRTSTSSATMSSRTGRRSRPIARRARRSRRSASKAASTNWPPSSASTRCCCARRTPPRTAPRRRTGRPTSISAMPRPSTRPRTTRI